MLKNLLNKIKIDYGRFLLFSAVAVGMPRWAGAMLFADMSTISPWVSSLLNTLSLFSGFAMGLLEVLATAYLLDALRDIRPHNSNGKYNFKFLVVFSFIAGTMIITPIILSPYLVARMNNQSIALTLNTFFWQYVWTIAVVIAPIFVIGGVAFSRQGLIGRQEKVLPKVAEVAEKLPEKLLENAEVTDWRNLSLKERHAIRFMTKQAIVDKYGVAERTATGWKQKARNYGK